MSTRNRAATFVEHRAPIEATREQITGWLALRIDLARGREWAAFSTADAERRSAELRRALEKWGRLDLHTAFEQRIVTADRTATAPTLLAFEVPRVHSPTAAYRWDATATAALPLTDALDLLLDESKNPEQEVARRRRILREQDRESQERRRLANEKREQESAATAEASDRLYDWQRTPKLERAIRRFANAQPHDSILRALVAALDSEPDLPHVLPEGM